MDKTLKNFIQSTELINKSQNFIYLQNLKFKLLFFTNKNSIMILFFYYINKINLIAINIYIILTFII